MNKGLSQAETVGILGNLQQESSWNPESVQAGGPGRGIAQWSVGGRWQPGLMTGNSQADLSNQLNYMWSELSSNPGYGLGPLEKATTPQQAAQIFGQDYERYGVAGGRYNDVNAIWNQLGNPAGTAGTAGAQGIANTLGSQLTPQTLSQLLQDLGISGQIASSNQMTQLQEQILGANYGYQQQQFGVQGQQLGLSELGSLQGLAHNTAGYKFEQQQDTLTGQGITAAINNILQNYGVQTQQLAQTRQETQQGNVASGVYNTGTERQAMHALDLQQSAMNISEQYSLFQQGQARQQLGLTEQEQKEQYGYSQSQLENGYKAIKLQQKQLGISEAQAATQYQNALQQLGLSGVMNAQQLQMEIAGMAGGGYSPISSFMGQLMQALPSVTSGLFVNPSSSGG
jgi:hypothetical protein